MMHLGLIVCACVSFFLSLFPFPIHVGLQSSYWNKCDLGFLKVLTKRRMMNYMEKTLFGNDSEKLIPGKVYLLTSNQCLNLLLTESRTDYKNKFSVVALRWQMFMYLFRCRFSYPRTAVIYGKNSGSDRHFGEIAAFNVGRLLGLQTLPAAVGRKVLLTEEVIPVSSRELAETFYVNESSFARFAVSGSGFPACFAVPSSVCWMYFLLSC